MKKNIMLFIGVLAALSMVGVTALADFTSSAPSTAVSAPGNGQHHRRHHHHMFGFIMGACVGQAMAAKGETFPLPQKGVKPTPPSAAVRAEIRAAVEACRAELPMPPHHQWHHHGAQGSSSGAQ